jgi:serine/threonine-protein kinase
MSANPEQEYFCDGISESIINALTNIKNLQVVARTSAFSFKGKEQDVRDIGKRLNVNTVLEGSVQKADNRIRITAQLINVEDGYHLWSERFDGELKDIFDIQDEISLALVEKLKPKLLRGVEARLVKRHTDSLEAYNLYLKGLYFWNKRTGEGMKKGMEYFKQAIENDPTYALAYVGLADCYSALGFWGFLPAKDAFPKAKALSSKSLEMDDTLAEAYASLGLINTCYDWDWPSVERRYSKAFELNPGYAHAHYTYALYLAAIERFTEAFKEIQIAIQLDPLSLSINSGFGCILYFQRQYDQAIEQLQKTLEMDPDFGFGHFFIGRAYAMTGKYVEAIAAFQKGSNAGLSYAIGYLGYVYAILGEKDKVEELLHELEGLSKKRYVSPLARVMIYIGLAEYDKAFELLERSYEDREAPFLFSKVYPEFDSIRPDPRFKALLKKMKLE